MSNVYRWSGTAASNNETPPAGLPELMPPSQVNNAMRANAAGIRTMYASQLDWRPVGSAGSAQTGDEHTITHTGSETFTTAAGDNDTTAIYAVNRRIRAVGETTGTIYGTISASAHTSQTTVTVAWDSGSFSADSDLVISVGHDPTEQPIKTDVVSASGWVTGFSSLYYDSSLAVTTPDNEWLQWNWTTTLGAAQSAEENATGKLFDGTNTD